MESTALKLTIISKEIRETSDQNLGRKHPIIYLPTGKIILFTRFYSNSLKSSQNPSNAFISASY